jgi:hypothetical protein
MLQRLLKGSKPKPKTNRRLSPEELAEKYPKKDIGYPFTKELRELPMGNFPASAAMRARQVGDETMEMVRRSVSKMDLPQAKKIEAIRKATDAMQAMPQYQLAKRSPSTLADALLKFGLGATVGYGVADNKEAIAEMLRSTKMDGGDYTLPFEQLIPGDYTLPFEQLIPGAGLMGALGGTLGGSGLEMGGFPQGRKQQLSSGPIPMRPGNRGQLFDRPDEEPGLEEGSIDDLLLWNRMFGG